MLEFRRPAEVSGGTTPDDPASFDQVMMIGDANQGFDILWKSKDIVKPVPFSPYIGKA